MILLVAEKPSVATQHYKSMLERCEGEKFSQSDGCLIGKNHCITWCVGHLITLAPLDAYPGMEGTWKLNNLPLLPEKFRLMEIESTQKQLNIVRLMMEKADIIINGADAGREGNLIFDLILDYTPQFKQKQIKRLWVNSYVAKDLDKAWKNLEDASKRINLSYAARLRQRADWMVGLNTTRAYTLTAGKGKLISVGRVQTPTLNLIVERDKSVEGFKELFYYSIVGTWNGYQAQILKKEKENENLKVAFFDSEKEPNAIIEKCSSKQAKVISVEHNTKKQFPPKPFDLTELQKEGNKRFKMSAQQVLDCAQNLYEKKLLTYPRTDSAYLPDSMQQEAYQLAYYLSNEKQKELMRPQSDSFAFINSSKVTDHYAIIPTSEQNNLDKLTETEKNIYSLVVERFTNSWLKPYIWKEMDVLLSSPFNENNPELFRFKLKKNEDEGFRGIVQEEKKRKAKKKSDSSENEEKYAEDEITNIVSEFPDIKINDQNCFDKIELQKKKKNKPKYYTEATLLAAMKTAGRQIDNEELADAMKDRGLGTPATQAGIIETLKKRGFIEAQKNSLVSTIRGREIIELMDEKIKSPEMTGEWEYKLSQVEKGLIQPADFKNEIVEYIKDLFLHLKELYKNQFERENCVDPLLCYKCNNPMEITPWGYICKNENCDFKISHTFANRILSHEEMRILLTEKELPLLTGFKSKKGTSFSAKLKIDENANITFEFLNDGHFHGSETQYSCPLCKQHIEENTNAYFCSNSSCGFTLFKIIASKKLEKTDIENILINKKTSLIQGFKSKKGTLFDASLFLSESGKVQFHFENKTLTCPLCLNNMRHFKDLICCSQCNFTLPKVFYQREFSDSELEELLKNKKTPILENFKKDDKIFKSALYLKENGKLAFNKLTLEITNKV